MRAWHNNACIIADRCVIANNPALTSPRHPHTMDSHSCLHNGFTITGVKREIRNAADQTSDVYSSIGRSTHVARDKHQYYCNYYFFILYSACCTEYGVNDAVAISILKSDIRIICIHICSNVASVDFCSGNCYLSISQWTVWWKKTDRMSGLVVLNGRLIGMK